VLSRYPEWLRVLWLECLQQQIGTHSICSTRQPKLTGDSTIDDGPKDTTTPKEPQILPGNNYKGFVAGVFSGISKLTVGHPFDTIKVRLQTSQKAQFRGPLDCLLQTIRKEGITAVYKGATPPLLGWMASDSIMLGSLTIYRKFLLQNVFANPTLRPNIPTAELAKAKLPTVGHGIAGLGAGLTVSFIACPIEHVKARLQVQYAAKKSERFYRGPIDCAQRLLKTHGLRGGLYHGLFATSLFRSFFFFWWGSYDIFTRMFEKHTSLSQPAINFWAGGFSAQVFWLTSYPSDVVKQRIMTDPLGGALGDGERKFPRWRDAARAVYRESGWRGYWRGFVPCFLRAFPANAAALMAFEAVMRSLPD
jgi:solute carrier family 25 (mitochondrial carnitine/acylcarnitine transporter), member 20/29